MPKILIQYDEGPDFITLGIAGQFQRGKPKATDKKLADLILSKKTIKFKEIKSKEVNYATSDRK